MTPRQTPAKLTCLLVGAHFRPPAKQLLSLLQPGQALLLVPEPDNAYDPEAVKVMIDLSTVEVDASVLDEALQGTGFDSANLLAMAAVGEPLQLGYLAARANKQLKDRPDLSTNDKALVALSGTGDAPWPASLGFELNDQPIVIIELSSSGES